MWAFATVWNDLVAPVIIAAVGGAVAVFWPWLQSYWRGRKFESLIRRELQELTPAYAEPQPNTPWWGHLRKRFVHEEIFALSQVSQNRDFLLSLNPTVVYQVSQLWIAYARRDAVQFLYFVDELAASDRVGSPGLRRAAPAWHSVIGDPRAQPDGAGARTAAARDSDALLGARLAAYASLLPLTRYGSDGERADREAELDRWFYDGGGLLLSSPALRCYLLARRSLTDEQSTDAQRRERFSALRTALKIEVGVVPEDERGIPMASIDDSRRPLLDSSA